MAHSHGAGVVYPLFPEDRPARHTILPTHRTILPTHRTILPTHRAFLPAHRATLVLVHGWGLDATVWRELAPLLRPYFHLVAVDLPGYGRACHISHPYPLEALAEGLLPALPRCALYLGWSFGALLCLELARRHPARVRGVVAVASSPCFRAREGWPWALPAAAFAQLRTDLEAHPAAALRRFLSLLVQGEGAPRRVLPGLRAALPKAPRKAALLQGLAQLEEADLRVPLERLVRPCRFLLGERDALVPVAQGARLAAMGRSVSWELLPGTGHVPLLSRPRDVARAVLRFAEERLWHPRTAPAAVPSGRLAVSFGGAAAHYDRAAQLQRQVGETLLQQAGEARPGCILDLGCGTGHFLARLRRCNPQARLLALDLAPEMVRRATRRRAAASGLCADGYSLPLGGEVADLVFVNLVLQWCSRPERLLGELYRVLRPGGRALVSTFVRGTLWELRAAWRAVDEAEHVNLFAAAPALEQTARQAGFAVGSREETLQRRYRGLRELMYELRQLGAGSVHRAQTPPGVAGFRRLFQAEEALRDEQELLPVSWRLLYLVLQRPHG